MTQKKHLDMLLAKAGISLDEARACLGVLDDSPKTFSHVSEGEQLELDLAKAVEDEETARKGLGLPNTSWILKTGDKTYVFRNKPSHEQVSNVWGISWEEYDRLLNFRHVVQDGLVMFLYEVPFLINERE